MAELKCSLTGRPMAEPVISKKSGYIFERSEIESVIRSTGRCPITDDSLELTDLMPVKAQGKRREEPARQSPPPTRTPGREERLAAELSNSKRGSSWLRDDGYLFYSITTDELITFEATRTTHKNCDVLPLPKAYNLVREKSEKILARLNVCMQQLALTEKKIEERRRDVTSSADVIIMDIKESMQEVRDRLRKKEEELIHGAEQSRREYIHHLDRSLQDTLEKYSEFKAAAEIIEEKMADRSEVNLLSFYSSEKEKLQDFLANPGMYIPELPEDVEVPMKFDTEATKRFIDELHTLHLSIATMGDTTFHGPAIVSPSKGRQSPTGRRSPM